ncbi:MAG: transglutaminase domain-containing protein, partial [Myxococcales bacterium]|nr:transglutaminase domain-containing protein [Myxococcales bacterium]
PAHAGAWRIALQAAWLTGDLDGAGDALAQLRLHSDATLELEAMASEAGVGGAAEVELLLGQCPKGVDTPLADLLCGKLAFDPWPWVRPAQPGDLPPGQDPADRWASHQSVLLLDRVVDRVLPDGRAMTSFHAVSRLQTKEAADRAGELELPTDALALALVTLKPDGRRLEVDRHAGKDDLSFSALAPGDAVERRWVRIEGPATPWGGYIRKFYFASGDPMVRSELAVVVKKGTRVLHLERNGAPAPQIMEAGDEVLYLWQAEQVPAVPPEPHTPGADEFLPHVVVSVGVSPQHALATQQLGTDEAARGSRQVADQALVLTATIAEPQAERAAGRSPAERGRTAPPARDPMEARAERLFHFVVESIDDGPPRPPELVLDTRRGERSGLFVALLRAAEIPADVVWARAGMAPPLDPAAPDPQAFGIRLVRLEPRPGQVRWASLEGKRWWYGAPPPYLVGGAYLRRTGPRLEVLPLLDEGADGWAVASRAELTVAQDGHAQGRLEITLPAGYASSLRAFLRSARAEDKARQLQGLVAALLRGGRLLRSQATPLDAPLEPLTLTLEVEVPHFMVPDGDHLVAEELFEHPPGLRTLGLPLLEAYLVAPRRETPLLVRPASEHLQVTLHLPAGARADVQPGTFERKLPFGHFAQRFELDPATGTARLDLQYTLRMVRIPPDGAGNPGFASGARSQAKPGGEGWDGSASPGPHGFSEFARAAQEVIQATRNRLVLQRGP